MVVQIRKQRRYEGLVRDIRTQIEQGVLHADHYLLPESELAKKYNLSARAVREGLGRLEDEGWIRRHQGRGTIVLPIKAKIENTTTRRSVAVVFQGRVSDPSTAEELDAFQQAFQEEGYGTTLYVADGSPEKETQIVEQLAAEGVPGLMLYSAHASDSFAHLKAAQDKGVKIAVYDHDFPDLDCNFAGIDDRLAGYEATQHLIRLGCRELLMINARRDLTSTRLRQRGFEEACAATPVPRRVIFLETNRQSASRADQLRAELLAVLPALCRPVGVFVWCDEVALETIDCLEQAGWRVPNDVKVIGLGNIPAGAAARIPLSTLDVPRKEMARLVALALVNQMRFGERAARRVRLKARLIIRESCGNYSKPPQSHNELAEQGSALRSARPLEV